MSKYCMYCGTVMEDQDRFCPQCGGKAEDPVPAAGTIDPNPQQRLYAGDMEVPQMAGMPGGAEAPQAILGTRSGSGRPLAAGSAGGSVPVLFWAGRGCLALLGVLLVIGPFLPAIDIEYYFVSMKASLMSVWEYAGEDYFTEYGLWFAGVLGAAYLLDGAALVWAAIRDKTDAIAVLGFIPLVLLITEKLVIRHTAHELAGAFASKEQIDYALSEVTRLISGSGIQLLNTCSVVIFIVAILYWIMRRMADRNRL